jgi:hypothetical protein
MKGNLLILFEESVNKIIRVYYQYKWAKMGACLAVFHLLIHFGDNIKWLGPVHTYWQYPMERLCGIFVPFAKSKKMAYESLVNEVESLQQIFCLEYLDPKFKYRESSSELLLAKNPSLSFPPFGSTDGYIPYGEDEEYQIKFLYKRHAKWKLDDRVVGKLK